MPEGIARPCTADFSCTRPTAPTESTVRPCLGKILRTSAEDIYCTRRRSSASSTASSLCTRPSTPRTRSGDRCSGSCCLSWSFRCCYCQLHCCYYYCCCCYHCLHSRKSHMFSCISIACSPDCCCIHPDPSMSGTGSTSPCPCSHRSELSRSRSCTTWCTSRRSCPTSTACSPSTRRCSPSRCRGDSCHSSCCFRRPTTRSNCSIRCLIRCSLWSTKSSSTSWSSLRRSSFQRRRSSRRRPSFRPPPTTTDRERKQCSREEEQRG